MMKCSICMFMITESMSLQELQCDHAVLGCSVNESFGQLTMHSSWHSADKVNKLCLRCLLDAARFIVGGSMDLRWVDTMVTI